MSKNYKIARVVDTRLLASESNNVTYVLEEGAKTILYMALTANSYNDQTTNYNLSNISQYVCRDPRIVQNMGVTITWNVTNTTGAALNWINASDFCWRSWPVARAQTSINHQIGGAVADFSPSTFLDVLEKLNCLPQHSNFWNNTYPDLVDNFESVDGANISPMSPMTTNLNGDGVFKPRTLNYRFAPLGGGLYSKNSVNAGATVDVIIEAEFHEPLLSPLCNISDKNNQRGLYAISGEIVKINQFPDLTRMFNKITPAGFTLNSTKVTLSSSKIAIPYLDLIYLTPYESMIKDIPHTSIYEYNDYNVFNSDLGPCLAGQTLSNVPSVVCSFINIPSKVIVCAKLNDKFIKPDVPDKYLKILRASVTFDQGLPCLQGANTRTLWEISKRNGLSTPSYAFEQMQLNSSLTNADPSKVPAFGNGSVLVIDPAIDCAIRANSSTSSAGKYTMQITCDFENATLTDFAGCNYQIIAINKKVLSRTGLEYQTSAVTLPEDVLKDSRSLDPIGLQAYLDSKNSNLFLGAGFTDYLKKAAQYAKKGMDYFVKHKNDLNNVYNVGRQIYDTGNISARQAMDLYDSGSKLAGGKKKNMRGGADLIYSRDMRPANKNMELFYE